MGTEALATENVVKRGQGIGNAASRVPLVLAVAALVLAGSALAFLGATTLGRAPGYTPGVIDLQIAIVADLQGEGWDVWLPNELVVHQGDTVKLTVYNADEMDHGLYIEAFEVNQPIAPGTMDAMGAMTPSKTVVTFLADKAGHFLIQCNVPCGDGHAWMIGTLVVLSG